jgi:3-phenylpropionate/cinnamic acid dioxygenase small subunit
MRRFSGLKAACVGALIIGGCVAAAANAAEPANLAARVQRIEDHEAIERLLMEYGRSLDNRDFATYSHLFASNGEWSGSFGSFRGPAAIQAAMEKTFANAKEIPKGSNFHMMSNVIIDLQGDRATASSKWIFFTLDKAKPEGAIAGRYDDVLIRENGAWKFLKRVAAPPVDKDSTALQPAAPAAGK